MGDDATGCTFGSLIRNPRLTKTRLYVDRPESRGTCGIAAYRSMSRFGHTDARPACSSVSGSARATLTAGQRLARREMSMTEPIPIQIMPHGMDIGGAYPIVARLRPRALTAMSNP